ncbi:fibronectin type III domain-containing protein [Candidatus Gracilibacteria bacterium]|nr:fibronectin type III domain-containing protein [Candidatus Gracilibacteria bacterium]
MKKILIHISVATILLLQLIAIPFATAASAVTLTALDTVYGFGSLVRGTGFSAGQQSTIIVATPSGLQQDFSVTADRFGMVRQEINKQYLNEVGDYIVSSGQAQTTFTVYDLGTSSLTLGQLDDVGGDDEVLLAQASGEVARFVIDSIPASAATNEQISFRVTAVDAQGAQVAGYRGTTVFTTSDPNADAPTPYTFTANDQGRKTFDVSLSFGTAGNQTLTVRDQANSVLRGEKVIVITSANQGQGAGSDVRITRPAAGTYIVNTMEVAGEAIPNARVQIFDNGQQISEVQANSVGRFTYTTSLLSDGQHTFQAQSNGSQSVPVIVTIDSTPSQVQSVEISERTLAPGATTLITLHSDADLTSVQVTVGDFITDLEPDPEEPGTYRGTITAPQLDGDYTVNAILTDKVGNVAPPSEVGKITVDSALKGDGAFSFSVPSKVKNVRATTSNGSVSLQWDAAVSDVGVAIYRIYYGINPRALSLVVNTPDAKPEFTISGLENGKEHYFQVVGIDTQGNEGDNLSDVVIATPGGTGAVTGTSGDTPVVSGDSTGALCDPSPCASADFPPAHADDGPGIVIPVIVSLIGGAVLRRKKKCV